MGKLADDLERLAEEVGELREERANFLKELEANEATRREEAEEAGAERQSFVSGLRGDVGEMLDGFRAAHEEMGQDLRERLEANERSRKDNEATRREEAEEAGAERQSFVSGLRGDVGEMLDGFRAAHEEMGEQTRRQLSEVRSDLEAGRRAFFGPGPADVRAEQARRRAERERKAKEKAARARRRAQEAKRHPDDLTAISGIGPKSQERLNRAGIYTYKQLAQSTPEGLREASGELPPGAAVEDWIAGARELV